jgi:hypothetical protein
MPVKKEGWAMLQTNGTLKADWVPPEVFFHEPLLEKGDFFQTGPDHMIINERARIALESFFSESAQLLPLPYKDQILTFVNIIKCYDVLDHEKSIIVGGQKTVFVFDSYKLPFPGIFKIPETRYADIFVYVDTYYPESDNFILQTERNGLQGLSFRHVWSDEKQ